MIPIGMAREHKLPVVEPEPIGRDEVAEWAEALYRAFHDAARPDDVARVATLIEPERALAVRDGGRMVATAGTYARRITVPGAELPVAAVTMVGVRASHRRRGLLTAMMRRQLDDLHEAGGEPIAALWAAEAAIYGRFGYGMATMAAALEVNARDARLRAAPELRAELAAPDEVKPQMAAIYDAARAARAGMLDRADAWWDARVADPEHRRDGAGDLQAAVIEGHAYALYAVKQDWSGFRSEGKVLVREAVAASTEGHAAIWAYLLGLDLTTRIAYDLAAPDDPLPHVVTEAQAVRMDVGEALWVRLVDLPRALAARAYTVPFETVLEVGDDFCPWNAGRWALAWDGTAATCERTDASADLSLTAADLGAAYLGGTTLDTLARAGRVRELRPGALGPASLAFRGQREPWCPEVF
jgi:predicted acetyltransferase